MNMKKKAISAIALTVACTRTEKKPDAHTEFVDINNALLEAAKSNDVAEAWRLLIATGADVNAKDSAGRTALIIAAQKNAADVARLLIQADADVNAEKDDGYTALMIAEKRGADDVAALLKAAGAQ